MHCIVYNNDLNDFFKHISNFFLRFRLRCVLSMGQTTLNTSAGIAALWRFSSASEQLIFAMLVTTIFKGSQIFPNLSCHNVLLAPRFVFINKNESKIINRDTTLEVLQLTMLLKKMKAFSMVSNYYIYEKSSQIIFLILANVIKPFIESVIEYYVFL